MNLNTVLRRFPVRATLNDESSVVIRPLTPDDKIELRRFFLRVPAEDRYYLNNNVTAPDVIREFTDGIDMERVVPLVAESDGHIVADATLHRSRRAGRRHVGELRIVVDPEFRGRALGSRLTHELIELGRNLELQRLVFELVNLREQAAIHTASQAGFQEVAILKDRVVDMYGSLQDLVIMELSLDDPEIGHLEG
ncbi:MAG: GNAT family N-acetyltransferase [SAR202 cluster bacterium]|jgi:L-amino acid N-acyltransferase YncA|nr:GNAT family N-acetyltransferase [SAR202 cluster bacterium]MDP6514362.1 GNAT family N-acetyltransferase [SAR202 cluster bacterium]MDP6713177.1 GNAT family N-acetyltransferase [SAR202 cluster bacterium]